jgi:hypothetical protein
MLARRTLFEAGSFDPSCVANSFHKSAMCLSHNVYRLIDDMIHTFRKRSVPDTSLAMLSVTVEMFLMTHSATNSEMWAVPPLPKKCSLFWVTLEPKFDEQDEYALFIAVQHLSPVSSRRNR